MNVNEIFNSLVIVGGWNRHIFTDDWIKRFIFPNTDENFDIVFPLVQDIYTPLIATQISANHVQIQIQDNRLEISRKKNYSLDIDLIQEISIAICDSLPHTPVSAYGINLLFVEDDISDELLNLVRSKDLEEINNFGASLVSEQYNRSFNLNGRRVNLSVRIDKEKIEFDTNVNFNISSLVEFKEGISNTSIVETQNEIVKFIKEIYGIELEGENE